MAKTKPSEVYTQGNELERRLMNRAIFEHIEIGPDAEITGSTLTPTYAAHQPKRQKSLGTVNFQPSTAPPTIRHLVYLVYA